MKFKYFAALSFTAFTLSTFSLTASAEMLLFVRDDCQHCQELDKQLEAKDLYQAFNIQTFEISGQDNQKFYIQKSKELGYDGSGVPLLVDGSTYKEGTSAILSYLNGQDQSPEEGESHLSLEEAAQLTEDLKDQPSTSYDLPNSKEPLSAASSESGLFSIKNIAVSALVLLLLLAGLFAWRAKSRT